MDKGSNVAEKELDNVLLGRVVPIGIFPPIPDSGFWDLEFADSGYDPDSSGYFFISDCMKHAR